MQMAWHLDPLVWIAAYFVFCIVAFTVLLFGDQPVFRQTPVHWCHVVCVDIVAVRLWYVITQQHTNQSSMPYDPQALD